VSAVTHHEFENVTIGWKPAGVTVWPACAGTRPILATPAAIVRAGLAADRGDPHAQKSLEMSVRLATEPLNEPIGAKANYKHG
jgi:hypothetical protein